MHAWGTTENAIHPTNFIHCCFFMPMGSLIDSVFDLYIRPCWVSFWGSYSPLLSQAPLKPISLNRRSLNVVKQAGVA